MKTLSVFFFVMMAYALQSQDLNIYYDVHNDSMWYVRKGKVIDEPIVKKGDQVYFHLVEFNNYIYKAEFKATNSTAPFGAAPAPGNSLVKSLLSGLVSGFVPGAGLGLLSTPLFGNILGAIPENADGTGRGEQEDLEAFHAKVKELEAAKEEINNLTTELNMRRKSLEALNSTFTFTNELCKSKNVAPSLIKELLIKHCTEIFLKSANENLTLDEIATLNTKLVEIPKLEKALKDKMLSYDSGLKDLKKQREKLQRVDHGIDALYPLIKKLEMSENQLENTASTLVSELDKQCAVDDQMKKTDYTSQIQQFYLKYHEIKENSFSFTHHASAEQKYLIYEMDLYALDSASTNSDEKVSVKHIEVKVKTYGGTQFGLSVGLVGSKFAETPQGYFIRNDEIFATDKDPYVPFVSSMFNLSYDLGAYISPAVSLGIGIPLSSDETSSSFALFAGPGMYIGKKQAFMVSTGAMFTKTATLAKGFLVGDKINIGEGEIPTDKKFALGYFISVTYNLSAM